MSLVEQTAPFYLPRKMRAAANVDRVRDYLLRNLGCSAKEAAGALGLSRDTVEKAIRVIRGGTSA